MNNTAIQSTNETNQHATESANEADFKGAVVAAVAFLGISIGCLSWFFILALSTDPNGSVSGWPLIFAGLSFVITIINAHAAANNLLKILKQ